MRAIEKFVGEGIPRTLVVPRSHLYGPLDLGSAVEEAFFRTAIDNLERILGMGHAQMLNGIILLGRCLIFQGNFVDAETQLSSVIEAATRTQVRIVHSFCPQCYL